MKGLRLIEEDGSYRLEGMRELERCSDNIKCHYSLSFGSLYPLSELPMPSSGDRQGLVVWKVCDLENDTSSEHERSELSRRTLSEEKLREEARQMLPIVRC